jgi:hypothetical protein
LVGVRRHTRHDSNVVKQVFICLLEREQIRDFF